MKYQLLFATVAFMLSACGGGGSSTPSVVETEQEIRQALVRIRLDVFNDKKQFTGKVKKLKKNLARVLTYKHMLKQKSAQQ